MLATTFDPATQVVTTTITDLDTGISAQLLLPMAATVDPAGTADTAVDLAALLVQYLPLGLAGLIEEAERP
jgi:hypothetical protein